MSEHNDPYKNDKTLAGLTLGKSTQYQDKYNPKLLQAVPRSLNREAIACALPFQGCDLWTGYELSWLNIKGKPMVAIGLFEISADSTNLVESKSFKLYLNSFNQTKINSIEELQKRLQTDLSHCAEGEVSVKLILPEEFAAQPLGELKGKSIDHLDIDVDDYQFNPEHLDGSVNLSKRVHVEETLRSDLLKSNCLITSQPDWGSVMIHYQGPKIDQEALLRYLISFRRHNEFHEQCVERIFMDLMRYCHCEKLTVYARYTRRGGLDINPFRTNFAAVPANIRLARQ